MTVRSIFPVRLVMPIMAERPEKPREHVAREWRSLNPASVGYEGMAGWLEPSGTVDSTARLILLQ
jgi:hypothetical protein